MVRIRSLLATLRIPNAPSVVSNVVIGYLLGRYYWGDAQAVGPVLAGLSLAALSLYFAGNLANDWFDRDWDAKHRPERSLPSGQFRPSSFLALSLILGASGIGIAFLQGVRPGVVGITIAMLIAIYTLIHKRTAWGVLPMGLCRAGLYVMGFLVAWPVDFIAADEDLYFPIPESTIYEDLGRGILFISTHAVGLLVYIAGLSLAARTESLEHPPHSMVFVSRAMLLLPLAALSAWWVPYYPLLGSCGMIAFSIWLALSLTIFRKPVPRLVSALLAGIPLIDFIAAVPLGSTFALPGETLDLAGWLAFGVPPVAFVLGRLLQWVAPAT